ncbi:hypothetical protein BJ875DRAFT_474798 [Amylocarpus encephaloides]|uniref:NAD(P)-binding domain-containing protein n=1 Tax=Amylocarpus encephaloides TaxID=45428 RepID=A0A9P7Y979_9HELO|nr:hypothetical protein BJ875DRAFT_474798 [Amylocarpus encephaloides]
MPFIVSVAGATGRFARCLVFELLKMPDISIRGFARSVAKAPSLFQSLPRTNLSRATPVTRSSCGRLSREPTLLFAPTQVIKSLWWRTKIW